MPHEPTKPIEELVRKDDLLAQFAAQAEAEGAQGDFYRPPYLRIREEKVQVGKVRRDETRVIIVDPNRQDEKGQNFEASHESVEGVLLAWKPYGILQYNDISEANDGKGAMQVEAFHLDTKKRGISVGRLHNGARPRMEVEQMTIKRDITTFNGERKFSEPVRFSSRAVAVFLLKKEYWIEEDEPLLVFAFLSASSVYGGSEDRGMTEDLKQYTLSAFGPRNSEERGVLPTLQDREWILGGQPKTPKSAIWLNIYGEKLGTPVPVHAFDFDRDGPDSELTMDELAQVARLQGEAEQMLIRWAAGEYMRALPGLTLDKAELIASLAYHGKLAELQAQASAISPTVIEADTADEADEVEYGKGDDLDDGSFDVEMPF